MAFDNVASLLQEQCMRCYGAFEAFQKLVRDHEASIVSSNPEEF